MATKTTNAKRVLQLMDSCVDGDNRYCEFVKQVSAETGVSVQQINEELDHWI